MSEGQFKFVVSVDDAQLQKLNRELKLSEQVASQAGKKISDELAKGYTDAAGRLRDGRGRFVKAGEDAGAAIGEGVRRSVGSGDYAGLGRKIGNDIERGLKSSLDGLRSAIGNIFQGIFQGIGQSIYGTLQNGLQRAFSAITDQSALVNFDKARASVSTLTDDVQGAIKVSNDLSKELRYSASSTEILAASYDVLSAGFTKASDSANVLRASQKGAIGGFSDLNTVSNATTTVLNAYSLSSDKADKVVNQFIGTQNAGKIVVSEYARLIGRVASTAAQAGVPLEELNAFIATATVKGVAAGSTMDGLRQAISSILKPSQEASEYAAQLGVGFDAAALRSKGLSGILADLNAKGADSVDSLTKLFGSVEAVAAIVPSAGSGIADFQKNLETIKSTSADDAFEKIANSMEGLQKRNQVLREELSLKFQTAIAPVFAGANTVLDALLVKLNEGGLLFNVLNQAAASFRDYLQQNPETIALIIQQVQSLAQDGINLLAQGMQSFTQALQQNPQLIQTLIANVQAAAVSVAEFAQGFGTGFNQVTALLAPLGEMALSLTGVASASGTTAQQLGQAAAQGIALVAGLAGLSAIVSILAGIGSIIGGIVGAIAGIPSAIAGITAAWGAVSGAVAAIGTALAGIGAFLTGPVILGVLGVAAAIAGIVAICLNWDAVLKFIGDTWQALTGWVSGIFNWIVATVQQSNVFMGIWNTITGIIKALLQPYINIGSAIGDRIKQSQFFQGVWQGITGTIGGVADAVKNALGGALDGAIKKAQEFFGWLKNITGFGGGQSGNNGGQSSAEQYAAAAIAILEAPSRQGRVDVAQVMATRAANNFSGFGTGLRDQVWASGQFEPTWKYGIGKGDIQDEQTAIAALQKAGYTQQQAAEALKSFFDDVRNSGMIAESERAIDNKAYFLGKDARGLPGGSFQRFDDENQFFKSPDDSAGNNYKRGDLRSLFGASGGSVGAPVKDYAVVPTGTLAAQEYGASRSGGGRKHAGQDFDLGDNDEFQSYIGGRVTQMGDDPGGYFKWIDIYNERLKRVERIAELDSFNVKEGDIVQPGQMVGRGTTSTGVVHYEIRNDADAQGRGGFGYDGTEDPIAYLEKQGIVKRQGTNLVPQAKGRSLILADEKGQQSTAFTESAVIPQSAGPRAEQGKIDNTIALNPAAPTAAAPALPGTTEKAIEAARKLVSGYEKDRREQEKKEAEIQQQRDRVALEKLRNEAPDQDSRKLADQTVARQAIESKYSAGLVAMGYDIKDLESAKEKKIASGVKTGPDYSAAIRDLKVLIDNTKRLRDEELASAGIAIASESKREALAASRQVRDAKRADEQKKALLDLQSAIDLETDPLKKAGAEGTKQTVEIEFDTINATAKLRDDLEDAIARREYAVKINADPASIKKAEDQIAEINRQLTTVSEIGQKRLEALAAKLLEQEKKLELQRKNDLANRDSYTDGIATAVIRARADRTRENNRPEANRLDRQVAIAEQEVKYKQQILELENRINEAREKGIPFTQEQIDNTRSQIEELNNLANLDIASRFKEQSSDLQQALEQTGETARTSFGGAIEDLLAGTKTLGEAFGDLVKSILGQVAKLAANSLLQNLFGGGKGSGIGGIFTGGSGTGLGGSGAGGILMNIVGGIFGAKDGGFVPNFSNGGNVAAIAGSGYRSGYGEISAALQREGNNAVLAALTPGELVLSLKQVQKFRALGMDKVLNFADGGSVPGGITPTLRSGAIGGGDASATIVQNIQGGGEGIDWKRVAQVAQMATQAEILRQKRPRGSLSD